ncbi:plasmodesmata-located protein 7-like [Neltuma alba]|uniref:plasmodesmata-located protein 7-like n=1 Tax=Neltuma alba TaxID=207710 RepID=UPI0010A54CF1|nr:plasmodesmata-located protein 7-like [Prosopis alba]
MLLLNLQQNPLLFTFLLSFTIWTWWTLDGVVSEPQLSYVKSGCSSYNVSDVAIFNKNLNATMRSLRAQVSNQSKHSAVAQAVKGNNPAYGVFQCRNYLSIKDCLACFDFAAVHIYENCSVSATGARVIYEVASSGMRAVFSSTSPQTVGTTLCVGILWLKAPQNLLQLCNKC